MKKDKIEARPIEAGCYVLDSDVVNPKPDRRASRDWTNAPTWEKGMRLFVRPTFYDVVNGKKVYILTIEYIGTRWSHMNIKTYERERWNAITEHMKRVEEDFDFLLHRLDVGSYSRGEVLRQLVKDGKITHGDIETAYERSMRDEPAEESAKQE